MMRLLVASAKLACLSLFLSAMTTVGLGAVVMTVDPATKTFWFTGSESGVTKETAPLSRQFGVGWRNTGAQTGGQLYTNIYDQLDGVWEGIPSPPALVIFEGGYFGIDFPGLSFEKDKVSYSLTGRGPTTGKFDYGYYEDVVDWLTPLIEGLATNNASLPFRHYSSNVLNTAGANLSIQLYQVGGGGGGGGGGGQVPEPSTAAIALLMLTGGAIRRFRRSSKPQ
jgi:hypothetical protein